MMKLEDFSLPKVISSIEGQKSTKIGIAIIKLNDTEIVHEICQEMFSPESPSAKFCLDGAEVIMNSSGSHHSLRKLNIRLGLIKNSSEKNGGVYMYSNQQGCDGSRLYYDGSSMTVTNGKIVVQGSQFSIKEREAVIATVDLDEVRNYRREIRNKSLEMENEPEFNRVMIDYDLCKHDSLDITVFQGEPILHTPEEEISLGPALWMWDYLRRSGARGFFLPLSGGLDSASVSTIIGSMSHIVFKAINEENDEQVLSDLRKIVKKEDFMPSSPKDIAGEILYT